MAGINDDRDETGYSGAVVRNLFSDENLRKLERDRVSKRVESLPEVSKTIEKLPDLSILDSIGREIPPNLGVPNSLDKLLGPGILW